MTYLVLAQKIGIHPETVAAVEALPLPSDKEDRLKEAFSQGAAAFAAAMEKEADPPLMALKLFLRFALDTRQRYRELGIPETVLWESLSDLTIWADDYREKTGKHGTLVWKWLARTLNLEVFRLGRLQFQPEALRNDAIIDGVLYPAGTEGLKVHVAAGAPLSYPEVLDSLRRAPDFFRTYFGKDYTMFHCHSWLLSPALPELLPEDSSILRFYRLFSLYTTIPVRQAEERVFGQLCDDPADYPENTRLQRSMKQYLLTGKPIHMGSGIAFFTNLPEV